MKNETASREIEFLDYYLQNHTDDYSEESHTAMIMAIKALEQEPCGDAISRKAVLQMIEDIQDAGGFIGCSTYSEAFDMVDNMPPVTLTRKTGHWILADEQNKEDVENDNYRFICSECQCSDIHAKNTKVPYCWKCGAKMIEPQESEE